MAFPRTLADLIDVGVACDPERTALVDRHGEWSYAELDQRASQVANGLIAHGVGPGQRVAVLIGNESRFVEALLGTWRAGAVSVLANTRLTPSQIADQVADSQAVVVRTDGTTIFLGEEYDAWRESHSIVRPEVEVAPDEVGMQPYTSGSTGKPKGVLLTHRGQLHNARVVGQVDMIGEDERALVSAPIFHANAMASAVLPFLLVGGSVVILPRFEVESVAAAIARHRCTFMTGVPSMYAALLNAGAFERHHVSSLRFVACGSAPVTRELLERLESVIPGVVVMEGYGLTEGGWLRTGDLAHADADGFLYFHGRLDDMMNVGGENVYPQTVESLIRQYPGVADVAVVASVHATKGQVPVAFVVGESTATVDPEKIKQFCLENGPAFAHPRRVRVVDQLPVSAIGKLDRKRLTVMAAEDTASPDECAGGGGAQPGRAVI